MPDPRVTTLLREARELRSPQPAPTLSIIVPMYNEEDVLDVFFPEIISELEKTGESWEIVCVDDGSHDRTVERLLDWRSLEKRIRIISLARNFGKEAALSAGIDHALGAAVIPMDCDLQDPPTLIHAFLEKWRQGYEVVYGRRVARNGDTRSKRTSASAFYRVHNAISDTKIPENAGDFRLMDRRVVDSLRRLPERNRFMKGLFTWVGFRQVAINYERPPRAGGTTKWNYWKLWNFALDGITSFSTLPLRIWTYVGLMVSALSFLYAGIVILRTLISGIDVPGYASTIVIILFLGGVQLTSLGVIGEYIGRLYFEAKSRPLYIIRDVYE